jgi:hypothetical protein
LTGLNPELPECFLRRLYKHANRQHSTVQDVAIRAIENGLPQSLPRKERVQLPLIRSTQPGSLRSISGEDVDALPD